MSFHEQIRPHVEQELDAAKSARQRGEFQQEFSHLENAHVLGQRSTRWHVITHVLMWRWAWRQRDTRELFGQVVRIVGAATKTFIGLVPTGNTGGSDVHAWKKMPLSEEHAALIARARE